MAPSIVVSYDGTPDDDDALALGKVFAQFGASVALAYVRHSRLQDEAAEEREGGRRPSCSNVGPSSSVPRPPHTSCSIPRLPTRCGS